ncbi:CBO0543 family protein [Bacillus sp. SCS-153A]|uniref:CBO0543 family protein n=1 Tax=Rossellomorea sedimentorum TaxID=3115294 RepID=UPI00390647E6
MSIIILILYILAGIRYGKWSKFQEFYPTLLFLIIGDLLSQFLLFDHTLWKFHPMGQLDRLFHLNHTFIALAKMAIQYTVTVSIFIGRLPKELGKQVLMILVWTSIYGLNEFITNQLGGLSYHRGWSFGWDLVFNVMMFTMLVIHYKKPLIAWMLTGPIIVTLWLIFDVPLSVLK